MKVTNTLAYYGTEKITTVKKFYSTCIFVNFVKILLMVGGGQSNSVVPCNLKIIERLLANNAPSPSGGGRGGGRDLKLKSTPFKVKKDCSLAD
jgi:hypothetical protein